jgi:hypothetical protein
MPIVTFIKLFLLVTSKQKIYEMVMVIPGYYV